MKLSLSLSFHLEMALYTTAGSLEVRVASKDPRVELKCNVELWPYQYMIHDLKGSNGKHYSFDVYVDEEGILKGLEMNEIATYLCHPFNIATGRIIVGDALIVPLDENEEYTLEDFEAMYDGVWVKEDESNIALVEENIDSTKAVFRYLTEEQKAEYFAIKAQITV